jgi:hypothetical protein
MPADLRIFVNERAFTLPAGSTVRDALRLAAPELLLPEAEGSALVTDGRGVDIALDAPLSGGAILRAHRSSRRG